MDLHILSERELTEQTPNSDGGTATMKCNEIKITTEEDKKAIEDFDINARQLSLMVLQRDLMKNGKDQMFQKVEELLCQRDDLRERLATIKKKSREEGESFLQEMSKFNSDFSLQGKAEMMLESQTRAEIRDLERKAESLHKDIDLMVCANSHVSALQKDEGALQLELQELGNIQEDLDVRLKEAEAETESLRAESLFVRQKPLTDSTCLRLRNELEKHKEGELELLKEALDAEIQILKSRLDGSQGSERQ